LRREKYRERERMLGRKRQAKWRRTNCATPRAESASRTKPWLAAGYKCRSTWERHGKMPKVRNAHTSCSKAVRDESAARPWKGFPPLVVVSAQRPVPRGSEGVPGRASHQDEHGRMDAQRPLPTGSEAVEVSSRTATMIWRAAERASRRAAAAGAAAAPVRGGAPEPRLTWLNGGAPEPLLSLAPDRLTWLNGERGADEAAPIKFAW
jgi:hypothetical protein